MKLRKHLTILGALSVAVLLLAGCGKAQSYTASDNSNYPITWKVEKNGNITVKLDGSYAPDYSWELGSFDESVLSVKAGEEKKGVIKYTFKPLAEGETILEFKRMRATAEVPVLPEPDDTDFEPDHETTPVEDVEEKMYVEYFPGEMAISGVDENGSEMEEMQIFEQSEEQAIAQAIQPEEVVYATEEELAAPPEDVVCSFSLAVWVKATGKKQNQFSTDTAISNYSESEGLMTGGEGENIYRLWKVKDNEAYILMPDYEFWTYEVKSEYSGRVKQAIDEYGNIVEEKVYYSPERDEDGNAIILDVRDIGSYRGLKKFELTTLAEGTATVTFTSEAGGKKIIVEFTIDIDGNITGITHTMK